MSFVPAYILILGFTICIDYCAGIFLEKTTNHAAKKTLLIISLIANIGVLVFFKYFNFLNHNLDNLLGYTAHHTPFPFLTMLLPIGLSFHTFQAMSYTIEVYRGNYKAEKHFGIYALYVMFYPQLVAGPIERPQNILWQFHKEQQYSFENLKSGLMQMAFGLFKKVVIADRIAQIVDKVYADPRSENGSTLLIVTILYSFQIYCDFSGYSDIGIGAARTMGYKLVNNFNVPYLSKSLSEFWSKWHMSLSTWFRDYLYFPLGGSRVPIPRKYLNLMIVFLISGLWHGANWTFVIWGALHGALLIIEHLKNDCFKKYTFGTRNNRITSILHISGIFFLVTFTWIFFRSPNLHIAKIILQKIFSFSILAQFNYSVATLPLLIFSFALIISLMIKEYYFLVIPTKNTKSFYITFILLLVSVYIFGVFNNTQFIYFQF
ncbi:MAG TPA: MBOAT family O-acyltransferase [Mucilaginibacter sp.]|jgi:D-alanyl-lipoteichoic acid acyltransferase DltB (MBOAT superfamily)